MNRVRGLEFGFRVWTRVRVIVKKWLGLGLEVELNHGLGLGLG